MRNATGRPPVRAAAPVGARSLPPLASSGCAVLFLAPFFLVGCVTTFFIGKHLVTSIRMQGWPVAQAVVRQVSIDRVSDGEGTSWEISSQYDYDYRGQKYRGTRVGIDDNVGFGRTLRQRARILREAQTAGQTVPCRINPAAPAESVLFTAVQWEQIFFLGIFSLVFGGFGAGGYVYLGLARRAARRRERLAAQYPDQPWMWKPEWNRGAIPAGARSAMLALWAFAFFWNAISAPVRVRFVE
ncbi:MAG: DUF3592 domain-containing protein, partial [Thermoguttaceae bacterium]